MHASLQGVDFTTFRGIAATPGLRNGRTAAVGFGVMGQKPRTVLSDWPVKQPRDWASWVSQPQMAAEPASLREYVRRGRPPGDDAWVRQMASKLNLQWTLHHGGGYRHRNAKRSDETA